VTVLSGKTRVYGIIGDPVAHSLSPLFQSRFIAQAKLDAVYVPFHVRPGCVARALDGLLALGVQGFNVTVPHKQSVLDMLDADADAVRIGAANTVKRYNDGWLAVNTDWLGIRDVLSGLGLDMEHTEVLIFGAGGTARAVVHALVHMHTARLAVCNRGQPRLQEFLSHISENYPGLRAEPIAWEQQEVSRASAAAPLLINTTSIGLGGEARTFPFALAGEGTALDAVYTADGITPFVRAAGEAGRQAMDGLALLVAQGAAAFRFWHDRQPDSLQTLRWLEERLGHSRARHSVQESMT